MIGVFIDIENFSKTEKILIEFIQNLFAGKKIAFQRAFTDWSAEKEDMKRMLIDYGVVPVQVISHGSFRYKNYQNSADISIAVDAINTLHTNGSINTFVIASGDGGIINLFDKLTEYGKKTISISSRASASRHLSSHVDSFYILEDKIQQKMPPPLTIPDSSTKRNMPALSSVFTSESDPDDCFPIKKWRENEVMDDEWVKNLKAKASTLNIIFQNVPNFYSGIVILITSWNTVLKTKVRTGINITVLHELANEHFSLSANDTNMLINKLTNKYDFIGVRMKDNERVLSCMPHNGTAIFTRDGFILADKGMLTKIFYDSAKIKICHTFKTSEVITLIIQNIDSITKKDMGTAIKIIQSIAAERVDIVSGALLLFLRSEILNSDFTIRHDKENFTEAKCREYISLYCCNILTRVGITIEKERIKLELFGWESVNAL